MERGTLQAEWEMAHFDGRTTTKMALERSANMNREYGSMINQLQGAGCPSRKFADEEDTTAGRVEVDWAGNVASAGSRKLFENDQRMHSSLKAQDGYFMSGKEDTNYHSQRKTYSHRDPRFDSSEGVKQSCPGGMNSSEWKSNTQLMMESARSKSSTDSLATNPSQVSRRGRGTATRYTGDISLRDMQTQAFNQYQERQQMQSSLDPSTLAKSGDFLRGISSSDIAKSLRMGGVTDSSQKTTRKQSTGLGDTLVLENYKTQIPGCTYHKSGPR